MDCFWEIITEPVLLAIKPQNIVEIGSEEGISTGKLLAYCQRHGAVLHAIDPEPRFDVAAWQRQYGGRFVMHRTISLQALPTLDRFDVVILDGDHNWYTVLNELRQIQQRSRELLQPFPMVLLHDIGWPYGRRDLYYNPDSIPEAFRQPYARKGLRPGVSQLVDGGFNAHLCNAVSENTPRNGVLTGVEDFLKEAEQSLQFLQLPGFFGYGLLFPRKQGEQNAALANLIQLWNLPEPVQQYIKLLEFNRVHLLVNCMEMWQALQQLRTRSQPESFWGQAVSPF